MKFYFVECLEQGNKVIFWGNCQFYIDVKHNAMINCTGVMCVTVLLNQVTYCDIWWHISGLTLAAAMACYLIAPCHNLNQSWLLINRVLEHLLKTNSTESAKISICKMSYKKTLSLPSATYMCWWALSALVQIMVWRIFGAKPLSKPMLGYYQLNT